MEKTIEIKDISFFKDGEIIYVDYILTGEIDLINQRVIDELKKTQLKLFIDRDNKLHAAIFMIDEIIFHCKDILNKYENKILIEVYKY